MALFSFDLSNESTELKNALNAAVNESIRPLVNDSIRDVKGIIDSAVDESIRPLVDDSIRDASQQMKEIIDAAGSKLDASIKLLSDELHQQRKFTREDIEKLIDYSANKFGEAIDQRINKLRDETSGLIKEKVHDLRGELESAAIRSRKTMYMNACISIGSALIMGGLAFVYKKISMGQLDLLVVFRIVLLSLSIGSGSMWVLKMYQRYQGMGSEQKSLGTVFIGYLGVLRPNGAFLFFFLFIALLASWFALTHLSA